MKLAVGLAVATVIGVIGATILVGANVREETVVARPYEDGLRHDAERTARAALGLAMALDDDAPTAGATPLVFRLSDREGRPLGGARVAVELSRPDTSRGEVRGDARELVAGRYAADLAFPAPGPWDVRLEVERGPDRVRLERRVVAAAACDLAAGACARRLSGDVEVKVALGPRPLRTMRELVVSVAVGRGGAPDADASSISVAFSMPGMEMGENRVRLERRGPGLFEGRAVLVRCPSGRRDWTAAVSIAHPRAPAGPLRFPLTVEE